MMLFISTSGEENVIALCRGQTFFRKKEWPAKHDEAETLVCIIEKFLKSEKIAFENLNGIIVNPGPGAFTRTRIGVTAANVLSFALKIPLYEVTKTGKWRRMHLVRPRYALPPNITPSKQWSLGSLKSSAA